METPKEIMSKKIYNAIVEFNNETGACPMIIRVRNIHDHNIAAISKKYIVGHIEYEMA